MENKKLLYQLEYEVAELRKQYLNYIDSDYRDDDEKLTLREVLDLGFNNTYIYTDETINRKVGIYKDNENEYVANGYFIKDDELLNAEVKYVENETYTDYYGDYIEIYVEFVDKKYNDLLNAVVNSVGDDENE